MRKDVQMVRACDLVHWLAAAGCTPMWVLVLAMDAVQGMLEVTTRALQWSGNPYGNGYGVEMDGNGAQFVKMLWIGLDLGKVISLKR